jgi:hypothetical protein
MPRRALRQTFADLNANGRKYQVSSKASNEQVPALLGELVTRETNINLMGVIEAFLDRTFVKGGVEVKELAQCFQWLDNMKRGEEARIKELRAQLPDKNTEIKLGEAPKAGAASEPEAAVAVGTVEMREGERVL